MDISLFRNFERSHQLIYFIQAELALCMSLPLCNSSLDSVSHNMQYSNLMNYKLIYFYFTCPQYALVFYLSEIL